MKRLVLVICVLVLVPALALACGKERWPVKTGTDKDAAKVNESPTPGTINQLRQIQTPINPNIRPDTRYSPVELTTYELATPGSFTQSVVHPHARHWTLKGNREPSRLTISPPFLPHAGHDLRSVGFTWPRTAYSFLSALGNSDSVRPSQQLATVGSVSAIFISNAMALKTHPSLSL
jgi:hypothetical protein